MDSVINRDKQSIRGSWEVVIVTAFALRVTMCLWGQALSCTYN